MPAGRQTAQKRITPVRKSECEIWLKGFQIREQYGNANRIGRKEGIDRNIEHRYTKVHQCLTVEVEQSPCDAMEPAIGRHRDCDSLVGQPTNLRIESHARNRADNLTSVTFHSY